MKQRHNINIEGTLVSLFWTGIALFFSIGGIALKLGTLRDPGPGLLPFCFSLLLLLFGLSFLVKALAGGSPPTVRRIQWRRPAMVILFMALYIFLFYFSGFFTSTFIFLYILFSLLLKDDKVKRWYTALSAAFIAALVSWLVFSVFLKVPFPQGYLTTLWR